MSSSHQAIYHNIISPVCFIISLCFPVLSLHYLATSALPHLTMCHPAVLSLHFTHTWNQSMVQQLMREGNFLSLVLKASPMGLMASTMCSWSRHLWMNMLNSATGEPSVCLLLSRWRSSWRILSQISCFSSIGKRLGTSPAFSRLLMSSRKDSCLI